MTAGLRRVCLLGLVLAVLLPAGADADDWEWTAVSRIVAIGDIHGAYDNFVAVLMNAGLVDEELRWIGGTTHLVQNGDVVDRGPHSRKAMDLLMELEDKAKKAGGRVHPLIGNHEAMNVVGILDLVSKEEFESYTDRDSSRRRDAIFARYYDDLKRQARSKGEDPPKKEEARVEFEQQYPLGFIEHRQAFGADGRYGKWIRGNNVAVKINGVVFSHGDWSERISQLGIEEVNKRVRAELKGEAPLEEGLTFDAESPLQYRGLAHVALTASAQKAEEEKVSRIAQSLGARRMVVGHTLTSGVIESRFGGLHVSIDTGMLELYHGGHRVALEIENDALEAIHDGGNVVIPETMDETNFESYLRAVAEVDPENVDVQLKLVDSLIEERQPEEVAAILERLFLRPEHVPFRYRDVLGSYYESKGGREKANAQYREYIRGLATLVESTPDNLNLKNLLARFCVDKGLELELAERTVLSALEREPESPGFLLTRARLHVAQNDFQKALDVLEKLPRTESWRYDTLYVTGLAYAGMDEWDEARAAFQQAVEADPSRTEARDELKKLSVISPLN